MLSAEGQAQIELARLLSRRLERLSADSVWARRASGCRGGLIKLLEEAGELQAAGGPVRPDYFAELERTMAQGFRLLERAAKEIPA